MKVQIPTEYSLRLVLPGVVGLITTEYRGRYNVTTVSWLMPAGREPPLVAVAINPSTLCYEFIKRSGEFVINIPTRDVINQVMTCGRLSGNDVDKFQRTGLTMEEPKVVRPPWIEQCLAHLECAVVNAYQPGDHVIFVGQVAWAVAEEGSFEEGWLLKEKELKPLHHLGANWFAALEERIEAT
jgi:flavin reductase (DIM6/NTAB) family NADH-FMN oxidoreductase RutF